MYLWVICTALIVSVIGMGSMAVVRLERERAALEQDWHQAGILAGGAVEQGCARLAYDMWWRTRYDVYQDRVFTGELPLGRGFINWSLQDPVDSNLANSPNDPVRLYGRGRVGDAVQVCSVLLWPGPRPLDALRPVLHAGGRITCPYVLDARGGTVSSNGTISVAGGAIIGAAEARSIDVSANVSGGAITSVPEKPMPVKTLWEVYQTFATEIPFANLPGGALSKVVLTASRNPLAPGTTNPDAVYLIKVPESGTLTLRDCRIDATLLVGLNGVGARLEMDSGVVWQPGRPDFPALVVYFGNEWGTSASLVSRGQLVEADLNTNFNPPDAAYYGNFDNDKTDRYTASLRGLFHILRPSAWFLSRETTIWTEAKLKGCILADGNVRILGDSILVADPNLTANPPLGYTMASPPGNNLIVNGDMENGVTGWSRVAAPTEIDKSNSQHSGSRAIRVRKRPSAAGGLQQDVTGSLSSGSTYDIDVWLRMESSPEDAQLSIEVNSSGAGTERFSATVSDVQTGWTHGACRLTPTWSGTLNYANFIVTTTTSSQTFFIDDVQFIDFTLLQQQPPELTPIVSTWRREES